MEEASQALKTSNGGYLRVASVLVSELFWWPWRCFSQARAPEVLSISRPSRAIENRRGMVKGA